MDLLLKPVIDNYSNTYFSTEKQKSPSYVGMYTKDNKEIVMVYEKNKQMLIDETGEKFTNKQSENLDLTGSPLKLDLSLHTVLDETFSSDEPQLWTKEEGSHGPISIDKAREIANLYNSNRLESTEETLPMWILTTPTDQIKALLLYVQPDKEKFKRGIVTYEGSRGFEDIDIGELVENYAKEENLSTDSINITIDCKYIITGVSYSSYNSEELLNVPHSGLTQLKCEWNTKTLQTPYISCKVLFIVVGAPWFVRNNDLHDDLESISRYLQSASMRHFYKAARHENPLIVAARNYIADPADQMEQEVVVGHLASPCNAVWKSVCALHNLNQILVDMTAAGFNTVNLETAQIRANIQNAKHPNNAKRLTDLLNETELYAYTAECPAGGCLCVDEDTTSLGQCMTRMNMNGSSNDFTYKLWDILRDCETAEELITLLLEALKFISSGKIRPFIDANNKTFLSKIVLKLSRGHSQTSKVLKNLRSSPPQALSLVAQVGIEKTMWEYTKVMSLLEHSFYIAGIWNTDARSHESIEQINQTIQDMTMSGGDFTLNPFESLSAGENSIRLDADSFYVDDTNELTVDDFASLKKHGLVSDKKDVNEVPLITDEIDINPWKNLLTKFAQVHVCLEHLYRAETSLRSDFESLKPVASKLLEHYVVDKSPIRTVGQLLSDPVQRIVMSISNNIVQDHLKKPAFWYRIEMTSNERQTEQCFKKESKVVYVFSQQPVFPPSVWQHLEPPVDEVAEVTITAAEELKYYITKYKYISNKMMNKIILK